ncbi:MAG: biotin/lipoate A/B protein ligase family protein [Anaerolineaceae bacterium]
MGFEKTTWRLIETLPASGAWNMALDEAILESIGAHESLPVLRLYDWQPACLSLGYGQSFSDVDYGALRSHGWDVVRRATGGKAILHTDEITYSVIAPLTEPRVSGGVLESYSILSTALLRSLELLGLTPQADALYPDPGVGKGGPVCFEVPSNYEITVEEKKIIGSAQARRREGVLQHGALPLIGDLDRITSVLIYPDEAARRQAASRLLDHAATLFSITGKIISWRQAADAFRSAFEDRLGIEFLPDQPSEKELSRTHELIETKYAHPSWTQREFPVRATG